MSKSSQYASAAFNAIKSIISSPQNVRTLSSQPQIPFYPCTSAIGGFAPTQLTLSLINYQFLPFSPAPVYISNPDIRRATIRHQLTHNQGKIIPLPISGRAAQAFSTFLSKDHRVAHFTSATVAPENLKLEVEIHFAPEEFIKAESLTGLREIYVMKWMDILDDERKRKSDSRSSPWEKVVERFIFNREAAVSDTGMVEATFTSLSIKVSDHWKGMFAARGWGDSFEAARWVKPKGQGWRLYVRCGVWPCDGRDQRQIAEMFPLTTGYVELGKVSKPDMKEMLI